MTMKKLLAYMTLMVLYFPVFGQQTQNSQKLKRDFIKDTAGVLGLRARHFTSVTLDSLKNSPRKGRQKIDNIGIEKYFSRKSKEEIIALLGNPNATITEKIDDDGKPYKVDQIEYIIFRTKKKCDSAIWYGQPEVIDVDNPFDTKKGTVKTVRVYYGYDCDITNSTVEITKLLFEFYL
jgi:hypothetical protein